MVGMGLVVLFRRAAKAMSSMDKGEFSGAVGYSSPFVLLYGRFNGWGGLNFGGASEGKSEQGAVTLAIAPNNMVSNGKRPP